MKKFIALVLCLTFSAGLAFATADYITTNRSAINGKFTKTTIPQVDRLEFYGRDVVTTTASTEISSGEVTMGVSFDATSPYIYIVAKDHSDNYHYRTIRIGQLATYDAVTLP